MLKILGDTFLLLLTTCGCLVSCRKSHGLRNIQSKVPENETAHTHTYYAGIDTSREMKRSIGEVYRRCVMYSK